MRPISHIRGHLPSRTTRLGREDIMANVVALSGLEAQLAEIDENIVHARRSANSNEGELLVERKAVLN